MMTRIHCCLLLALLVAGPGSVSANDSSFTGLGNVPSGMGLGTTPGGKLDRKQDLSISHADRKHRARSENFHHKRKHKPRFHGFKHRFFNPGQIYIIQDPEARHRAKRYGEDAEKMPDGDPASPNSFERVRSDFPGSRSFEEVRTQFFSGQLP